MNSTQTSATSAGVNFQKRMALSWKYRLIKFCYCLQNFCSITHSFSLPAKEHTTKLKKLQHFFKLRNACFSGQCSPLVNLETTLVFKWSRRVWRNCLVFQSKLQRCMRVTTKVYIWVSEIDRGGVAIFSINVCDSWISVIYLTFVTVDDVSDPKDAGNKFHAGFTSVWKGLGWVISLLCLHFFL